MFKGLGLMKQVDHYRRKIETKYPPHPLHRWYLNQRERERGNVDLWRGEGSYFCPCCLNMWRGMGAVYKNMVVTESTTTEAEGRREPTQHGLLSCLADERGGWTMICILWTDARVRGGGPIM
jgi:hypothetical protein